MPDLAQVPSNNRDKGALSLNKLYSMLLTCKPANVIGFTARYFEDESLGNSCSSNNANSPNVNTAMLHDIHALPYLLQNPNEFQSAVCSIYCNIDNVHSSISQSLLNTSPASPTFDTIYYNNIIYKIDLYKLCQRCLGGTAADSCNISVPIEVWCIVTA